LSASGFFPESCSPKFLKRTLGSFKIFAKIHRDIHKSRCTTSINDTGGNFAICINDTVWKLAIGTVGVVDTGDKFATVVHNSGGLFPTSGK
jgi:hypothetical protein